MRTPKKEIPIIGRLYRAITRKHYYVYTLEYVDMGKSFMQVKAIRILDGDDGWEYLTGENPTGERENRVLQYAVSNFSSHFELME